MKIINLIKKHKDSIIPICNMIMVAVSIYAAVTTNYNTLKIVYNENKENHRPLIELESVSDYSFENLDTYQYYIFSSEYHSLTGTIEEAPNITINTAFKKIKLKNIGSGPAINIHIVDFISDVNDASGNFYYNIATVSNLSTIKIGVNGSVGLNIAMDYVVKNSDIKEFYEYSDLNHIFDNCFGLIHYEDLYGNVYNSIIDFTFSKRKILKNYVDMNSTIKKGLLLDKDYSYYSNKEYLVVDTMTYSLYDEGSWEYEYLMNNIQHRDINKILSPFIH